MPISVDPPRASAALKKRISAPFTFLCDPDKQTLDVFGLRHRRGNALTRGDIFQVANILVDRQGVVRWIYAAENYRLRAGVEAMLEEARKIATVNVNVNISPQSH